jgi:hypothetical protein
VYLVFVIRYFPKVQTVRQGSAQPG